AINPDYRCRFNLRYIEDRRTMELETAPQLLHGAVARRVIDHDDLQLRVIQPEQRPYVIHDASWITYGRCSGWITRNWRSSWSMTRRATAPWRSCGAVSS